MNKNSRTSSSSSSRKRSRATTTTTSMGAGNANTTVTPATNVVGSDGMTSSQPRRLKDLLFQYPNPEESGPETLSGNNPGKTAPSSTYQDDHQLTSFTWCDQMIEIPNASSSTGLEIANAGNVAAATTTDSGVTESIQSSLDQLGNDITSIKSQLEKKKAKVSLTQINNKLDQILQHVSQSSP